MVEYVKLMVSESIYAQKNLLHSELDLLRLVKIIGRFAELRKEEIVLRLTLKKKISDLREDMQVFDKLLPVGHFRTLHIGEEKKEEKVKKELKNIPLTLDQEIEMIRRRIQGLHASF